MKKNLFVILYGAIIIMEGIFLLFSKYFTFNITKYALGVALIVGALLAMVTAFSRQRKQVEFAYHEIHALAMLVYGLSILLIANTIEILSYITAFLLFFYAFSEITFCIWLFNLKNAVKINILFIRIFLGMLVGIGTLVVMNNFSSNMTMVMEGYGILFTMIGINVLLYEPIMKTKVLSE